MNVVEIRAAVTEAGFRVVRASLVSLYARHEGAGASLRAERSEAGRWQFTVVYSGTTYALTPHDIQELVYLLTDSFSEDARTRRRVNS